MAACINRWNGAPPARQRQPDWGIFMERRNFIFAGGALLGGAGLHAASAFAATPRQPGGATYQTLTGQSFNLYASTSGTSVTLLKVKRRDQAREFDQFSLLFAGAGAALPAAVYEIEHPVTGKLALYLEPAGKGPEGNYYRADFTLLASAAR